MNQSALPSTSQSNFDAVDPSLLSEPQPWPFGNFSSFDHGTDNADPRLGAMDIMDTDGIWGALPEQQFDSFGMESATNEQLLHEQNQHHQSFQHQYSGTLPPFQTVQSEEARGQLGRPAASVAMSPVIAEGSNRKRRGGRKPALDWDSQRQTIKSLYVDQGMSLNATMREMAGMGFEAGKRKYSEMIKKWKLEKNISSRNARFMKKKADYRRSTMNKDTKFSFREKPVPEHRFEHSPWVDEEDNESIPSQTPSAIRYHTPQGTEPPEAHTENRQSPSDPIQLTWNGLDTNALVALNKEAEGLAENGQITESLVAFDRSLDGLETLLGATHAISQKAMDIFIRITSKHQLHEHSQDRLVKTVKEHIKRFGRSHPKTLSIETKLIDLFMDQKKNAEAEKVLTLYIEGVEESSELDVEEKFIWKIKAKQYLCDIALGDSDNLKAEAIMEPWIAQAEAMGTEYLEYTMGLKHRAAHIYVLCQKDGSTFSSMMSNIHRQKAERYLHEYVEWAVKNPSDDYTHLYCSLRTLMGQYIGRREWDKLTAFCVTVENVIDSTPGSVNIDLDCEITTKTHLAMSMMALHRFDDTQRWLLHVREKIDSNESYGSRSEQSLNNTIQRMVCFIKQNRWDLAEPLAMEAQDQARLHFEAENPIHARLRTCLQTRTWETCCSTCCVGVPNRSDC